MYYANLIDSLYVRTIVVLYIGVLIYSLIISLRFNLLTHFHVLFNVLFCQGEEREILACDMSPVV